MVNLSLTVLLGIYGALQYKIGVQKILLFILPFIVYLWLLYISDNIWFIGIISLVFYALITSRKYVDMCKQHADANRIIED